VASILPVPARLPRRWPVAVVVLLGTALGLVAAHPGRLPGDPTQPFVAVTTNLHWQLHARGWASFLADDLHGFPLRTDRVVTDGFPLDALSSWPFCAAFGHETGMGVWAAAVLWAVGLSAAWLAARWWGTLGAALVAGAGFQVGEALLREVGEGRPTQAFAAIFLPFALGAGVEAARSGAVRWAVAAGLAAGFGTLASWGMGPSFALAALGPAAAHLGFGLLSGRGASPPQRPPRPRARAFLPLVVLAASFAVPVAPVIAWVAAGHEELPSFGMYAWQNTVFGLAQARPADLAAARIHGLEGVAFGTLARPALLLAAFWTLRRGRVRHWGVPLIVVSASVLLGLGSWLPGPVVLPWGWLQELPGLARLWWPDRAWIGASLGLALLAAGAAGRWAPLVAAAIYAEAWVASAALPFDALPRGPSAAAEVLARARDVPLVLLPTPQGPYRPDRLDLVDQTHHGRPLAHGTRSVLDLTGPGAPLRVWRNNAGLRALLACEMAGGSRVSEEARSAATAALTGAGLRDVYVDAAYVADDPSYTACIVGVLADWTRTEEPPLVRFRAP